MPNAKVNYGIDNASILVCATFSDGREVGEAIVDGIGHAYLFGRDQDEDDGWRQLVELEVDTGRRGDMWGLDVSIQGQTAVVRTR
jgi:hypothetical protein